MANASQFIGCKISLISKSEIRYEGILYSLDVVEATISLAKVKSFGTEDRPTDRTVPPKDEIYEFIIFRGSDIKGIDVVEPPKPTPPIVNDGLPNDPAIVEVSHYHTSSRSLASANIGPVPVQVQVTSAYGATSGPSYGTSPFPSSNAASTSASAMSKPVSTSQQQPQPSRTGSMSSKVALESPEPVTRFEVNEEAKAKDSSGSQSSTPAFTTLKPEENQARLSYGGSARGRDHGFNRDHRDERPRGGRGRAREGGYGSGRGRPQGSIDYTEGNDSTGGHRVGYGGGHGRPHNSSDYINTEEQDRMVRQRNQGGSYQPRGRGGAGNYSNASHIGSGGFRGGRGGGGFRNNRTQGILRAPQSAKVTFDNDFDFEKANEELQTAIKNLKLTEKNNEGIDINGSVGDQLVHSIDETEQQENREPQICYKKDDFFDSISCEALDRAKGGSSRPDWKAERKLNAETFGLTGRGRGSGGYSGYYNRGGGRGYYNNHGGGSGNYGGGGHRGNSRGGGYYNNNRFNGGGRRGRGISDSREESARGSGLF